MSNINTTTAEKTCPPLDLDAQLFRARFPHQPFLIRHSLANHPLFEIERLLELAKALPDSCVEYNEGRIPINMGGQASPRTGLSAEETIRRVRDAHSWMVLKYVEKDPAYRCLLNECLDQIQKLSNAVVPGMSAREGFIFLSSPHSITPFHVDPEHNFLLQIHGWKTVNIFDSADRLVITEPDIERGLFGENRNLTHHQEFDKRGQMFELTAGMGLHFPVVAPHWVKNGDDVSISFSITFRSHSSDRAATVRQFNARLRQRGFQPSGPGTSAIADAAKYQTSRVLRFMRRNFVRIPRRRQKTSAT